MPLQYLEDNEVLITTILECINTGRVEDAVQYQQRLQQNLMWLAGIADTQPQPGAPPAVIPVRASHARPSVLLLACFFLAEQAHAAVSCHVGVPSCGTACTMQHAHLCISHAQAPTVPPPPGQMQLYATGGQVVLAAQAVAAAAVQAQQSTAQQPGAAPAITQPPS